MLNAIIYGMVFCGAALMIYNIYGFISFARSVRSHKAFENKSNILYIPIFLLVMFFLGYLAVGIFGKPDLIVAGILFGGSIFVCIIYFLLRGITQRIIKSEKLETKLMATQEADRAKTAFLASISHEMRTPMNVIMGLDSIALLNPDLAPDTRQHLERIGLSAKHLLGMINNILDINRMETGNVELRSEQFSLNENLKQINAIVETMCEQKGLIYQLSVQPDADGTYVGDSQQLSQVLLSILDNAVKYTESPGSISLDVGIESDGESVRTLRFSISDTGVGIDKEFLPNVFKALSREDTSFTSRYGGSGLSMAVTKNSVELMGGTITVKSEKNVGSVFTVIIPLRLADADEKDAEGDLVSLSGRRVLIVEDLPENAEIVQDLLELEDVETEHAENGQIALEMYEQSPTNYYDAILMDLRMPVMDGLEATRRIRALARADAKTVPIIALTANAFESDVKNSLAAGMNAHMAKPTDADMLYEALKQNITDAMLREGRLSK